ncbi:hypothetical protein [Paucibacter sp. XJ19-41]|uniref:hypothetical protein n=1 Tax=Paucibacter sp. XJ19-41 TaxID=2927824 RepID=UPI002349A4DC|nr:hypothetical protein [Paucibacter sp. XJ19-41]MDC6167870.1 hypothetical protein [Paucibacter sp. XJ19-41]
MDAWALGLYCYTDRISSDLFVRFHDAAIAIFGQAGIKPTYFSADGDGYDGRATKFGKRVHARALKEGFSGVQTLTLVANPEGSDEPAYDSFASASISYIQDSGELLVCVYIRDDLLQFRGEIFNSMLQELIRLQAWDFGYAFKAPVEKKPEFHVLALDGGGNSREELRRLNAWYASKAGDRLSRLRDVYPIYFLNEKQLSGLATADLSLRAFAQGHPGSSLTPLDGSTLSLWELSSDEVESVREHLLPSGLLITR